MKKTKMDAKFHSVDGYSAKGQVLNAVHINAK